MADEVRVASVEEVPEGEIRPFEVDGRAVAIARDGGVFYAFENDCTHQHCTLDDGELEDGALTCACHGSTFELETGAVRNPPATRPLPVFGVRAEGDDLLVTIE